MDVRTALLEIAVEESSMSMSMSMATGRSGPSAGSPRTRLKRVQHFPSDWRVCREAHSVTVESSDHSVSSLRHRWYTKAIRIHHPI